MNHHVGSQTDSEGKDCWSVWQPDQNSIMMVPIWIDCGLSVGYVGLPLSAWGGSAGFCIGNLCINDLFDLTEISQN